MVHPTISSLFSEVTSFLTEIIRKAAWSCANDEEIRFFISSTDNTISEGGAALAMTISATS